MRILRARLSDHWGNIAFLNAVYSEVSQVDMDAKQQECRAEIGVVIIFREGPIQCDWVLSSRLRQYCRQTIDIEVSVQHYCWCLGWDELISLKIKDRVDIIVHSWSRITHRVPRQFREAHLTWTDSAFFETVQHLRKVTSSFTWWTKHYNQSACSWIRHLLLRSQPDTNNYKTTTVSERKIQNERICEA